MKHDKNVMLAMQASVSIVLACMMLPTAWGCASCGCTLSSDWENLNTSNNQGLKVDLRYDYLDQNRLRSGNSGISPQAASAITNDGNAQEVEQYTRNQYWTLGLDYSPNPNWGFGLQLPYIQRAHTTLGTASDGVTGGDGGGQYHSDTSALGDVRVAVRYQGFTEMHNVGVMVGLKLATGSHTQTGISTDPTAPGAVAIDRGLQPGTGTTDLVLGIYHFGAFDEQWSYFVQATYQHALNSKDDYRPGDGENLNVGLRYTGWNGIKPQLQLNVRHVSADSGANADTVSTGGTLAYLSPGLVVPVSQSVSAYGFVQLPVYENVRGVQLTPKYTMSAGLRWAF